MALSTFVQELTAIPEALREHYAPVDPKDEKAGFALATDDAAGKSKVGEFRSNNISLRKQGEAAAAELAEMKTKYADVDLDVYKAGRELVAKARTEEERKLFEGGDIEAVVNSRTQAMRADFDSQMAALTGGNTKLQGQYDKLSGQHSKMQIDQQMGAAIDAAKIKVRPGAMPDILSRTHGLFQMDPESGNVVARKSDGEIDYGSDSKPLTIAGFVGRLVTDASHLFEGATGGGGGGGSKPLPTGGGKRVIDASDPVALGLGAADIAAGKAVAVYPGGAEG